jgi:hypothetical protein
VLPELGAQHPLLFFELAYDLDQDVLRGEIGSAESVHPLPRPLADLGDPMSKLAHDHVIVERSARDRCQRRAGCDRTRLPVGDEAERYGPFGDRIGKLVPGLDELVELQVKRPKQGADDRSVQLLADQRKVDELVQGRLQLLADTLALMRHLECRQISRCCR